jgi:mycothiol synthase
VKAPSFTDDVVVRGFGPGEDFEAYVAMMNAAFADHPTPMSWTVQQIREVHALPDFDPTNIRLVAPVDRPSELIGFCVADIQPDDEGRPVGWVELVGVDPAWRGRGIGHALLRWGIAHTRARGASVVRLAVEAMNERALGIYRRAGFEPAIEWPHWIIET